MSKTTSKVIIQGGLLGILTLYVGYPGESRIYFNHNLHCAVMSDILTYCFLHSEYHS